MTEDKKRSTSRSNFSRRNVIILLLVSFLTLMIIKVCVSLQKGTDIIDSLFVFEFVFFICLLMEFILMKNPKAQSSRLYNSRLSAQIYLFGFMGFSIIDFGVYQIKQEPFINTYLVLMFLMALASLADWLSEKLRGS